MAEVIKLFCLCLLFFCSHALVSPGSSSSNATGDELALLSFKSMLSSQSDGLLASWNKSIHFCRWQGVVCGHRHPNRVVSLHLGSSNLLGPISPFLGNLSFLQKLELDNNQLVGQIPPELGHLSKLQELNLSTNSLHGSIPVAMGGCTNLMMLDLSSNQLQGEIPTMVCASLKNLVRLYVQKNLLMGVIPQSLAELSSIEFLFLSHNNLYGEIPSAFANLSNLYNVDLSSNMLSGYIPSSLGMLTNLSVLSLGMNNLTGEIPTSIWNISSLVVLSVQRNMLTGTIPLSAFNELPHLQKLYMDHNYFHGHIPASLGNASNLMVIVLGANHFSGIVPKEVGELKNLNLLLLTDTLVGAKESKDWEFITALTNCSQLEVLIFANCEFSGIIPESLSSLSTSLKYLSLSSNAISGSIPKDIGNLLSLQVLDLAYNYFTGNLPSSLAKLNILKKFYVNNNNINGSLPLEIGNLTNLISLFLMSNAFSGRLPRTLGKLTMLSELYLSDNNFIGPIPSGLFNISTLSIGLDLSYNSLEGSIPGEIGNLKSLVEFHAESNILSGEIPATLGKCQGLQYLYLQNNILNGNLAEQLSQLQSVQILDLSSNNLSGELPKFLGNLTMLSYLNLSFNNFVGEVPTFGVFANATAFSIQHNGKLCGGIPVLHLPPCPVQFPKNKHKLLVVPIVTSLVGTLIVLALLCKLLTWHKTNKTEIPSTTTMQCHPLISYSQLVKATDGFSATNLLGSGSFGSVYKGELHNGQAGESTNLVAVKVLKLQTPGAVKSFVAECEALRNLRHRNLVKIVTTCLSIDYDGNDFKAIVYEFMPNGSLEGWLHPDTNGQREHKFLNLIERVNILLDVAFALNYLHCHGPAPVIHCDLKSSNVLLDADLVAHVGDFGLAKILTEGSSIVQQSMSSMGVRGTIGYAAPEYGAGNVVSTNGDIYSYGILVLEMITASSMNSKRKVKVVLRRKEGWTALLHYLHLECQRSRRRGRPTRSALASPAFTPGPDDLSSGTGFAQPDPLTLTLCPGAAYVRDITEDPMLEEFAASIASTRLITGPSSERAVSPPVATPLENEALKMSAALLADEDPTATDFGVLRTPPPRAIQWAGGSPTAADPPSPEPLETPSSEVSDDTFQRRLDCFTSEVMTKRDSPLIREPPKQPPIMPRLPKRSRRLAAQPLSRVPASKRGEVLIMKRMGYIKPGEAPSASAIEKYEKLLGGDMTAEEAEALDALLPAAQPRRRKATL